MDEIKKKEAYQKGIAIIILLAVLSVIEFTIGRLAAAWWVPLMLIALVKAFFVVRDYMHIGRVFAGDEETH
jgi:Prokaryotic Cytochrome C oxidase subunit IV